MLSQARLTSAATAPSPPGSRWKAGPKSITGIARVASSRLLTAMALKMFIALPPLTLLDASRSRPRSGGRPCSCRIPRVPDIRPGLFGSSHASTSLGAGVPCRAYPSSSELGDYRVRPPDPAAQLAPQVGQERDRDGVMIPHQRVKRILGQNVADRLLVGSHRGRARLAVEERHLAEHGARGEGGQPAPPALPRQLDPHADSPARDQEGPGRGCPP